MTLWNGADDGAGLAAEIEVGDDDFADAIENHCPAVVHDPRRGTYAGISGASATSAATDREPSFTDRPSRKNTQMAETIARSQVLAAKRWMEDEAGMERASLSPTEYVAYRMKVSTTDAEALVAAVYALEEDE